MGDLTFQVRTVHTGLCNLPNVQQGALQEQRPPNRLMSCGASAAESIPSRCFTMLWPLPCYDLLQGSVLLPDLARLPPLQPAPLSSWSSLQSCPEKAHLSHLGVASL